jgi:hypothetical protein
LFKAPVASAASAEGSNDGSDEEKQEAGGSGAPKADSHLLDSGHGAASHSAYTRGASAATGVKPPSHSVLASLIFIATLALASLYSAMVLSNWAVDATSVIASHSTDSAMWAQFGSEIAVVVLFAWTLVAPLACPGRDFS